MTSGSDFKQTVRNRMTSTGENYTAALAALTAQRNAELAFYDRTVRSFFDGERLRSIPAKRRARWIVLIELATRFEPDRNYPEAEVNELLGRAHEDFALLRRELSDAGYLTRADGIYRRAERLPERPAHMQQEITSLEAEKLRL